MPTTLPSSQVVPGAAASVAPGADDSVEPLPTAACPSAGAPAAPNAVACAIYCDLDGVLADFNGGVEDLLGLQPEVFKSRNGAKAFWKCLREADDFFARLPWTRDGELLWKFLAPRRPYILSGCPWGH